MSSLGMLVIWSKRGGEPDDQPDKHHGQSQFDHRPGNRHEQPPPHGQLVFVVVGQLPEDVVQVPALLADLDQLVDQRREIIAGGSQGRRHRLALIHRLADGGDVAAQPACEQSASRLQALRASIPACSEVLCRRQSSPIGFRPTRGANKAESGMIEA